MENPDDTYNDEIPEVDLSDDEGSDVDVSSSEEGDELNLEEVGDENDDTLEENDDTLEENHDEDEESNSPGGGAISAEGLEEGPPEDLDEEDLLGDQNKKITHHDEILMLHPESKFHNYDEIYGASLVTRNANNIIVDMLHTTIPIMTKYEKTKVIGQRTKQLDAGNPPFIKVDRPTLDNSIIAEEELRQKKLPFIIQRPLPSGGFEYWNVKDLEVF